MPTVTVNLSDTFEQWRVKTNNIGTNTGDLNSLSTTAKGSLVDAINEVVSSDSDDMENLIDDTLPQLGGNLDLNNFNIINSGNGVSDINVSGSVTAQSFIGTVDIITDQSPELGASLDLNGFDILGTGSIADTVTGTTQSPNDNSTKFATTAYVDAQVSGQTISTLLSLTDTTITTPTNGQHLVYNSTTSKWENTTPTTTGATQGFAVAVAIALG
jgi:hypothetical protein